LKNLWTNKFQVLIEAVSQRQWLTPFKMKNIGDGKGTETSGFDDQALHNTPPSACHSPPQSVKDGKNGAVQLTDAMGMENVANRKADISKIEEQAPHDTPHRASQNEKNDNNETGTLVDGAEYPTGLRFGLIILALSAVVVLVNLDMNIVATAVPAITDHFHTVADVGWYSAAFRLTLCAFQFIFGKTYSLFPIKAIFLTANIVFLFGSALCAAATSSTMLVVGRAVTGLGAAGLNAGLFNILVQSTPLQVRPIWLGLGTGLEGVSMLSGPLLGGILVQYAGWRWCFYINLPLGSLAALLTLFCIRDKPKSTSIAHMTTTEKIADVDIVSNLIFISAMISLFLALSWGGTKYQWGSGTIIGLLVTAGVLLIAFVVNQFRRGDRAALPPRLMRHRSVAAGFLFMFFMNSAGQTFEYYLPTYNQTVQGYTPAESGYLLLPFIILGSIGAVLAGFCVSKFGYYTPFLLAGTVLMTVAAGLVTTFNVHTSLAKLIGYTCIWGIGNGISFGMSSVAVQTVLAADDVPLGLSFIFFAQSFGPSLAIVIGELIFQTKLNASLMSVKGLNLSEIKNHGLKEFIQSVPPAKAGEVLDIISHSLDGVWYFVVALAGATIIGSLSMEWRSVKRENAQGSNN
jgi:MFS family permease